MNKTMLIGIAVLLIGGGAYAYSMNQKEQAAMEQKAMEEQAMMEDQKMMEEESMQKDEVMEKTDDAMMEKDDAMMMSAGSYEIYAPEKLAMAEKGKVVLFFKASWCPTCRALDADIKAHLSDIPAGVTILEVDYDKATELKKKYGVTMQHTLVQVDAKGNQITKWSGGNTLASLVEKVK